MRDQRKNTMQRETAIVALMTEPTVTKAAARAGVGEATLYRWLREDEFQDAYRSARRDAFGQAIGRLQQIASNAVDTLAGIMADPEAPHHAKSSAAIAVLRFGRDGLELDDLAERVRRLEKHAEVNP